MVSAGVLDSCGKGRTACRTKWQPGGAHFLWWGGGDNILSVGSLHCGTETLATVPPPVGPVLVQAPHVSEEPASAAAEAVVIVVPGDEWERCGT